MLVFTGSTPRITIRHVASFPLCFFCSLFSFLLLHTGDFALIILRWFVGWTTTAANRSATQGYKHCCEHPFRHFSFQSKLPDTESYPTCIGSLPDLLNHYYKLLLPTHGHSIFRSTTRSNLQTCITDDNS